MSLAGYLLHECFLNLPVYMLTHVPVRVHVKAYVWLTHMHRHTQTWVPAQCTPCANVPTAEAGRCTTRVHPGLRVLPCACLWPHEQSPAHTCGFLVMYGQTLYKACVHTHVDRLEGVCIPDRAHTQQGMSGSPRPSLGVASLKGCWEGRHAPGGPEGLAHHSCVFSPAGL